MRLLVCGTRNWRDDAVIQKELELVIQRAGGPEHVTVIHGGARGADTMAAYVARRLGVKQVVSVPAKWERYGRAAGPIRNQEMLDTKHPDEVLAFFAEGKSVGTKDMVKRAREAGLPVKVVNS